MEMIIGDNVERGREDDRILEELKSNPDFYFPFLWIVLRNNEGTQ